MIIVSQDKKKIINFERITEITVSGTGILVGDDVFIPKGEEVGKYESEERAKEVLQGIVETYEDCNASTVSTGYGYVKNKVYEMPKK